MRRGALPAREQCAEKIGGHPRLSDADIRAGIDGDPDARATDENFWKEAQVVFPKPKRLVTLRLDADLLEWLRRESGYQTRINAILRAYMDATR